MRKFLVLPMALGVTFVSAAAPDARFTVAVIPDTQNYTDYTQQTAQGAAVDGARLFLDQLRFVAANAESAGGDIVFAIGLGDLWQHPSLSMDPEHERRGFRKVPNPLLDAHYGPTPQTRTFEIPLVREGYALLSGRVPFAVVPGNHDYDAQWTDANHPPDPSLSDDRKHGILHVGGLTNFNSVFSADSPFFKDKAWYVGSHAGGADSAQIFSAGGYRFLHIGLQFDAPNASLAWAASVIARFPGLPTLISTHNYLDPSGERRFGSGNDNSISDPEDNNPQMVWDKLVSRHDQIFMVLSGHRCGQGMRSERNRAGHEVYQLVSDYQCRWQAVKDAGVKAPGVGLGDGWLRLMIFDLSRKVPALHVRTYSTHYRKFSSDVPQYAAWYKADEAPHASDAEFHSRDDFVLELQDFRRRFDSTAKTSAAAEDQPRTGASQGDR